MSFLNCYCSAITLKGLHIFHSQFQCNQMIRNKTIISNVCEAKHISYWLPCSRGTNWKKDCCSCFARRLLIL